MKHFFLATLLILTIPTYTLAETSNGLDIIVTMQDVSMKVIDKNSKEIQIAVQDPKINYKAQFGNNQSTSLTPTRFASLWNPHSQEQDSFAQVPPNAVLSYQTRSGQAVTTNFTIKNVQQTTTGLTMTARILGGNAIDQNADDGKTSIVMLIDRSPFDPRDG